MKIQTTLLKTAIINGLVFFLFVLTSSVRAQITPNVETVVLIDGILNEQIWNEAKEFTDLVQIEPNIFAPASTKSDFYFTYDSQNIYIGGKIHQNKNTLSAGNARKDDAKTTKGDHITIGIDPLNNGNSAYFFIINPVNAQADGTIDIVGNFDFSWDAIFASATKIADTYWTFELKIPLTSLNFQNKETQSWGVMFARYYAHSQESSINQLLDKNAPFRVSDFHKIDGVKGLKKASNIIFTPYVYGYSNYFELKDSLSYGSKLGGEIKYNPTPSTTVLATFNPDYAQIETDKEVINVTDVPTTYPEKRPFFTESSDMYQGLAVNTRNITDINAGLKIRNVGKNSKIDFTTVYDKQKNIWGMGNVRFTDNSRYHLEVISGIKSAKTNYLDNYNYNITLHGKLYFFNKQMQVYTWYGTINMPENKANEYESVNAVKWISRTWNAGIWNHCISQLYNPNIVGFPTLSNQYILDSWLGYTFYNENGLFRKTTLTTHLLRYDLFTQTGNEYFENTNELYNQLYVGNTLGNWELDIIYKPSLSSKFRFRNQLQFNNQEIFIDAKSPFVLINQSANSFNMSFKTDASKIIGAVLSYDNNLVRKSKANNYSLESFLKIGSKASIAYTYSYVDIKGSEYQQVYRQSIHRMKTEYNLNEKINLRFIFQPISVEQPIDNIVNQNFIYNLTFSWEFMSGGNFYVVYNNYRNYDQYTNSKKHVIENNHALIVKLSKTF